MALELSLIIPVYRQEKTVVTDVKRILAALEKTRFSFEIICVVDGFVDKSYELLHEARLLFTHVYGYEKNHGKGFAIKYGVRRASGRYIMFFDSGMEIDTQGISMLMEHMIWYEADIIVGSKRHLASQVNYTPVRKILSDGYYWLVRILFGLRIKDTQAGIKLFRREVIIKILPKLVEKRFCGDLEMLVVARVCGFTKIYEAPIKLNYQFSSITSAVVLQSIWGMIVDTVAIWYRRYIKRWYHRDHADNGDYGIHPLR
jgi:glycosyltransferase involved in cell wall biosynthesis